MGKPIKRRGDLVFIPTSLRELTAYTKTLCVELGSKCNFSLYNGEIPQPSSLLQLILISAPLQETA